MDVVILQADELYRFYRSGEEETRALRGVSLNVEEGEVVAISGPSGSGKSTLLNCVAGLDDPDGGTVRISGTRVSHRSEADKARLRARLVGVVFQSGNLIEHLTVAQNARLAQGLAARPDLAHLSETLDRLGIAKLAHAWPSRLSGGEMARAALAVALACKPVLLVADEPTGELDAGNEASVLGLIKDQACYGVAVVIASHSAAVRRVADRVVHLADGRVA
ncbi:ATP-binding cassette domain-containing protein [Sphaerisporangium album]|uniref:ATP-binding cassette domain-containing protein n=1 Tax=Sphaerisporangium album TaxID=509200 RepID=A0A367FMQ3_9ACTN|nr:ATP-binding cassette domain-containing protein [Sphaerisporangium album]RCG31132.1 ATP-binding cassette domain-containing protein [Sphaerisporangium album]